MIYYCYIKSPYEYPDFEEEIEAKSKGEAIKYFLKKLNYGNGDWDESMIKNDVVSEKEMTRLLKQG